MATHYGSLKALLERFVEHNFGPREIQRLVESWDVLKRIGEGTVNPFASEREKPMCFYPYGWKPTTVEEQLSVLKGFYPGLDGSHVIQTASEIEIPREADGLFVIPKQSSVAAMLGIYRSHISSYGSMLKSTILNHLAGQRRFYYPMASGDGIMSSGLLQIRHSAADALRMLEETPGDFLVIAAQTGRKWGGYSSRNARWEIEHGGTGEFPLPTWVVGHILLTNPERLDNPAHLHVECPGDEWLDGKEGLYPSFGYDDGILMLGSWWSDDVPRGVAGTASGFLRR